MSSREKKSEIIKKEKRNLFIISALSVFEEKGFNNTRIKDITEKAGTSVGNFYNYFNSKEEVIEVLISGLAELMISKFRELFIYFKENRLPPISAVKNLFRGYAKMFRAKKETFLIFFEQMGGMDKKYRFKRNEILDNFTDEVEKIIIKLDTHNAPHLSKNDRILGIAKTRKDFMNIIKNYNPKELFFAILKLFKLYKLGKKIYRKFKKKKIMLNVKLQEINRRLINDGIVKKPLTLDELTGIVDIQSPTAGGYQRERGIDISEIIDKYLPNFDLEYFESYSHIFRLTYKNKFTRLYDLLLKKIYSKRGATFFAVLKKIS